MLVNACVDMIAGVSVAEGAAVCVCVGDVGTLYRGVGINHTGVLVGMDVGIGGVSVWQAAMEMPTSNEIRCLRFIKLQTQFQLMIMENVASYLFFHWLANFKIRGRM